MCISCARAQRERFDRNSVTLVVRVSFCKIDKPLHEWNIDQVKSFLGDLMFNKVLTPLCVKDVLKEVKDGMDLFFFTPENGNTTCSKEDETTGRKYHKS